MFFKTSMVFFFLSLFSCNEKQKKEDTDETYKTSYYFSGQLLDSIQYLDSVKTGKAFAFYPNGSLMKRYNNIDGNIVGLFEQFYENGHIQIRSIVDPYQGPYFIEKYDSLGTLISRDGLAVSPNIDLLGSEEFSDSVVVKLKFYISKINNCTTKVSLLGPDSQIIKIDVPRDLYTAEGRITMLEKGDFVYELIASIEDSEGRLLLSDSIPIDLGW